MKLPLNHNLRAIRKRQAFSLVEIMVAVGLLAFIIVGLLAMFYQTQRAFRSSTTQTDVLEAGRATMQMIRQDLHDMQPALHPDITNFVLSVAPGSPNLSLPLPPKGSAGALKTELLDATFLQRVNDVWIGIGYRVEGAASGVGTLKRMEERLDGARMLDTLDPYTDLSNNNQGLVTLAKMWRNLPSDDAGFHRVIDGVVHFSMIAYDTNGVPLDIKYPFVVGSTNVIPSYVDVELGILEPKTLVQFNARINTNDMTKAQNYLLDRVERIHMFKQRIPIRTRQ